MAYRKEIKLGDTGNIILGLVILFLFFLGFFYLTRFIFTLLYYLSPILFIATLIIDYKVVVSYFKWIVGLLKRNVVMGVVARIISVVGFPVVLALLLGRALLGKRIKKAKENFEQQRRGTYTDYEELESRRTNIELPEVKPKEKRNNYDELFED